MSKLVDEDASRGVLTLIGMVKEINGVWVEVLDAGGWIEDDKLRI